ncbi:MAG: SPOR domain-containing protein [Paludibacter sp.]|nr:SPOR domain-containing protein [Paludibacter sp.]
MNKFLVFILLSTFYLNINFISAQNDKATKRNIFDSLTKKDTVSGANVKIFQDKRVEEFITDKRNYTGSQNMTLGSGYRVQVFSSNTQRTAKSEAFKIEKDIRELYPEYPVYVNYTSPFWKVRVGDFSSLEQAHTFRNELIKSFPHLKSETYTVKDQINISTAK